MGAGFYGVPLAQGIQITLDSIRDLLADETTLEEVILCANDGREHRPFQLRLEQFPDN
jgi:O-acetyl-ADP-ribose deacetylase (regulator of RNase III)